MIMYSIDYVDSARSWNQPRELSFLKAHKTNTFANFKNGIKFFDSQNITY